MGIKIMKATTNAQRGMSYLDGAQLAPFGKKIRSLLKNKSKITGRGNNGITIRHRGGASRRKYRIIDFKGTDKMGMVGVIEAIEYDPNRTAYISLVLFPDGERRYHLAHKEAKVGDQVLTDVKGKIRPGNRFQLQYIPVGFSIYNVEVQENKGGQFVRSAGQSAKIVSLDGDMAQVEMNSGEIRFVPKHCYATIGVVSNEDRNLVSIGKAGRVRHMGRRPQVRGKAMNPCDHPHGGGEGSCPIGMTHPKTPWGAPALGVKTRSKSKSNRLIVRSRHRAKK